MVPAEGKEAEGSPSPVHGNIHEDVEIARLE